MLRILCTVLFSAIALIPARAEPIYFISVAEISPDKHAQYDRFVEDVTPIWRRHGMSVIARLRTVDALGFSGHDLAPTEIAVLRGETRAGFNAYIADPDYRAISSSRLDAVTRLIILEAKLRSSARLEFLSKLPMGALVFSPSASTSNANLHLDVTLVAPVKGGGSTFLNSVKSLRLFGISFDDNPTAYIDTDTSVAFISERIE